jgi:hypothetical protein
MWECSFEIVSRHNVTDQAKVGFSSCQVFYPCSNFVSVILFNYYHSYLLHCQRKMAFILMMGLFLSNAVLGQPPHIKLDGISAGHSEQRMKDGPTSHYRLLVEEAAFRKMVSSILPRAFVLVVIILILKRFFPQYIPDFLTVEVTLGLGLATAVFITVIQSLI